MTLIEFVRAIREHGYRYGSIDRDGDAYCYGDGHKPDVGTIAFSNEGIMMYVGEYDLTCSWKDTLIDVNKIKRYGMLNIEKGCQAIIINSTAGNDGKFVIVGDFLGKIDGWVGNDRWAVNIALSSKTGGTLRASRECQLMRIDGYKEETKLKEVEIE